MVYLGGGGKISGLLLSVSASFSWGSVSLSPMSSQGKPRECVLLIVLSFVISLYT